MKKILFVTAIAVLFLNQAFGQLELNSSGEVGIGASPLAGIDFYTPEAKVTHLGVNSSPINGIDFYTPEAKIQYLALGTTPSTSYRLLVSGVARFEASTVSAFQFSAYDMWEMQLLPSISLTNRIGSSSKQFYKIYGRYIYQNGTLVTSDLRLKENIRDLANPLDKILNIRGIQFDFKTLDNPEWPQSKKDEIHYLDKDRIGFIAQELMEVCPELVKYDEEIDQYSVDYMGVIPIIVEAIKEQQQQIDDLKQLVAASSGSLKGAAVTSTSLNEESDDLELTSLFQNHPNPFTEETTISYYLKNNTSSAMLFIYDMTGKQLMNYDIGHKGSGEIIITGGELDAGMYMYSLVADGQLIGTKQMLLTD